MKINHISDDDSSHRRFMKLQHSDFFRKDHFNKKPNDDLLDKKQNNMVQRDN